jgi:hypothetical protein
MPKRRRQRRRPPDCNTNGHAASPSVACTLNQLMPQRPSGHERSQRRRRRTPGSMSSSCAARLCGMQRARLGRSLRWRERPTVVTLADQARGRPSRVGHKQATATVSDMSPSGRGGVRRSTSSRSGSCRPPKGRWRTCRTSCLESSSTSRPRRPGENTRSCYRVQFPRVPWPRRRSGNERREGEQRAVVSL